MSESGPASEAEPSRTGATSDDFARKLSRVLVSKFGLTLITSLIALIAPITTLIWQVAEGLNQRALAKNEQVHEVRMAYLSLMTKPEFDDVNRLRIMRLLEKTEDDAPLASWAKEELQVLRKTLSLREAAAPDEKLKSAELERYLRALDSINQEDESPSPLTPEQIQVIRSALAEYINRGQSDAELRARISLLECEQKGGTIDYGTLECVGLPERKSP